MMFTVPSNRLYKAFRNTLAQNLPVVIIQVRRICNAKEPIRIAVAMAG